MKVNHDSSLFPYSVFLGGTCGTSTFRTGYEPGQEPEDGSVKPDSLIGMLDPGIMYFNPQLKPGEWNDDAAEAEDLCKSVAPILVWIISPEGLGTYSGYEIRDLAERTPENLIFCAIGDLKDQAKGVAKIKKDLRANHPKVTVCDSLEEVAKEVTRRYGEIS